MKMGGEQLIPAPRERVWEALNDPQVLKQCIPGCQEIVKNSPTEFEAKVTAKVGPVKANFAGIVRLSDLDPPKSYVISGEGKGGAAGFAKGGARVELEEAEGGTRLRYDVDAQVGGKLAQIGSRLIDSTARKMADQFFAKFAATAATGGEPEEAPPERPAAKPKATKKATVAKPARGRKKSPAATNGSGAETMPADVPAVPSILPEAAIVASATSTKPATNETPATAPGGNLLWWVVAVIVVLAFVYFVAK
jgi:carbon monoxide dehydrogenase subunit G